MLLNVDLSHNNVYTERTICWKI